MSLSCLLLFNNPQNNNRSRQIAAIIGIKPTRNATVSYARGAYCEGTRPSKLELFVILN